MFSSLQGRIVFVATLSLLAFLLVTGFSLDRAFKQSAIEAVRDRLEGQLFGLLASAEEDADGRLMFPDDLGEPRFSQPGSGLIGYVADEDGDKIWSSKSLHGSDMAVIPWFAQGERRFYQSYSNMKDDPYPFLYGYGVSWEDGETSTVDYTFLVAESSVRFDQQLSIFRANLIKWLSIGAFALIVVQLIVLRWALAPIRKVEDDVRLIERGELETLNNRYPSELQGLTNNINEFIANEKRQLTRYRNTLGDLAHSLKTPLAVVSGMATGDEPMLTQVDRMNKIIEHQLQRAAAQGRTTLAAPILVRPIVERILASMAKVYSDRSIDVTLDIAAEVRFFGEEGDLYEILGNLIDNAFKYGRDQIEISAKEFQSQTEARTGFEFLVRNDGEAIPESLHETVAGRGVRLDQSQPGQGIGLAVVSDIVRSYAGKLDIRSVDGMTEVIILIGEAAEPSARI